MNELTDDCADDPQDRAYNEMIDRLPLGAAFKRSLRDRDWAPPGGTSQNRHREMDSELGRAVLQSILDRVPSQYPDLRTHRFTHYNSDELTCWNNPILYWAAAPSVCYPFHVVLEHVLPMPEQLQRVKVRLEFDDGSGQRLSLIDSWLTDDSGKGTDPAVYADMILGAVERHGATIGYGLADYGLAGMIRPVHYHWFTGHGDCGDCGKPAAFHLADDAAALLCALCAANRAADGDIVRRIERDA